MLIYMDTCCFNRPYDDQSLIRNSLPKLMSGEVRVSLG